VSADNQSPELFGQTPWQTVGPFFHYALPWKGGADLVGASDIGAREDLVPQGARLLQGPPARPSVEGETIEIAGCVWDGAGEPVPDALVEIWQANPAGRYAAPADARDELALLPGFSGFGRAATAEDGSFLFRTLRPGRVPGPGNNLQAPHIAVSVMARGLMKRLATRLYFEDGEGNDEDPILALVPDSRRAALIARRDGPGRWRFDIRLRGPGETPFFEF
jgi:protocatechuate 3,4-dioxygenase alpha subunit